MYKLNKEISLNLLKLYDKINRAEINQIQKSKFTNITPTELHVLYVIGSFKNITSSEIAEYLKLSRPSLSRIIKSLFKKGYAEEKINPIDRRYHYIRLTKLGEKLFLIYSRLHQKLIKIFTQNLSENECLKFENALNKVEDFLDYLNKI